MLQTCLQVEIVAQYDLHSVCTCFIFLRNTPNSKTLVAEWKKEIQEMNAVQDQVNKLKCFNVSLQSDYGFNDSSNCIRSPNPFNRSLRAKICYERVLCLSAFFMTFWSDYQYKY